MHTRHRADRRPRIAKWAASSGSPAASLVRPIASAARAAIRSSEEPSHRAKRSVYQASACFQGLEI